MIACKMAVICPERILTMVLLAATGGGWDAIPMSLNALSIIAHGCFDKTLFGKARLETELIYSQKRLGVKNLWIILLVSVDNYMQSGITNCQTKNWWISEIARSL